MTCPAIDGIIEEANDVAGDVDDKEVLDAALLAVGAGRRALRDHALRHADRLGQAARPRGLRQLLQQNLDEEKATDQKLTTMAESKVNRLAA